MTTVSTTLDRLVEKAMTDIGATANAALMITGTRLGLFSALAEIGPATADELAAKTETRERYVREWLAAQAASGYVNWDALTQRFSMSPEQVMLFADEDSPVYLAGGFFSAASTINDEEKITQAFRTGAGIDWGDHHACLFCGVEKFFRPSYESNVVQSWIPSLPGIEDKLRTGIMVADLGCGHGTSTIVMAKAYPNSQFIGIDNHAPSIERSRELAAEEGLSNVRFELASAQNFQGPQTPDTHHGSQRADTDAGYELITTFDALHDMGDPRGAARRVHEMLKPDGSWMVVEPKAGDRLEENLHPVGRTYYAMSTSCCVPSALSQPVGEAIGAQAGPSVLQDILRSGGFGNTRIACETPFNLVLEARHA
ncbi:MAG: class I SAM-dependent methyltransferase [Planctomycetota bacterium]